MVIGVNWYRLKRAALWVSLVYLLTTGALAFHAELVFSRATGHPMTFQSHSESWEWLIVRPDVVVLLLACHLLDLLR